MNLIEQYTAGFLFVMVCRPCMHVTIALPTGFVNHGSYTDMG